MSGQPAATAAEDATANAKDIVDFIMRWERIVMVSHVKPDGDTLGAGLALGLALKPFGKQILYFQQDPVPRNLRFMADTDKVSREIPQEFIDTALWIFHDMSDSSRAGEFLPSIPRERVLVIDHHLGNTAFGIKNYILSDECSTGTCIIRLLEAMNAPVTPEIATALLTTIMTDTGGFMHTNTTAKVLSQSADLMRAGGDRDTVVNEIFANKRFAAIRLMGESLAKAKLENEGRYCWSYVDEPMLAACGADSEDTEEIIGHLRSVEGVEVAALFKSYSDGIRVSLRSTGKINVQQAAARLDGGGHYKAAGLSHDGPMDKAVADVHAALIAEGLR